MTLGERIRYYRKAAKKSQEELGNYLGIGKSSVSEWESGKRPIPIDVVEQLSNILDVSVPVLMGWDSSEPESNSKIDISPAALDLARKYDQLNDYSKKVVTALVDLELKRPRNPDYASETSRFNAMAERDRAATDAASITSNVQ